MIRRIQKLTRESRSQLHRAHLDRRCAPLESAIEKAKKTNTKPEKHRRSSGDAAAMEAASSPADVVTPDFTQKKTNAAAPTKGMPAAVKSSRENTPAKQAGGVKTRFTGRMKHDGAQTTSDL